MDEALANLLPVMIATATVPFSPIIVLLLLLGEGGLGKAIAFAAGNIAVRLVQGIVFAYTFGSATEAEAEAGVTYIASTLMVVIGILLLISAYKKWRKEVDPDDPPPEWMAKISGLSALKAAGAGALYITVSPKQWILTLAAITTIGEAGLSLASNAGLYLLFILVSQIFMLAPIVFYAVAPQQATKPLEAMQGWLERNSRTILILVSLVFGVWLLVKGINGLTG
jgi:hypothetical protein